VVQTPIVLSLEIFMQSVYIYHIHLPLSPAYVPATGPLDFGAQGGRPLAPAQGRGCRYRIWRGAFAVRKSRCTPPPTQSPLAR